MDKKIYIGGMTCENCQKRIQKRVGKIDGVSSVSVSYADGTADVSYSGEYTLSQIEAAIEDLGYSVKNAPKKSGYETIIGVSVVLLALYVIASKTGLFEAFNNFPLPTEGMGYGMIFLIGLLTSVHCIAMCGGINLSQSVNNNSERKPLQDALGYHAGRIVSYTVIGFIVGAIGSVISFSGGARGVVQIAAGVFMVIMGLNLLGIFPSLRKLAPKMPKPVVLLFAKLSSKTNNKGSWYVGLLNGLMPCGPLQVMQMYALSTGNPVKGAVSMFLFAAGTLPLMFGLSALSSFMSKKFTRTMLTASGMLVAVLGVVMFRNGLSLSGIDTSGYALNNGAAVQSSSASQSPSMRSRSKEVAATVDDNTQYVVSTMSSNSYDAITVTKGIPVKWTLNAPERAINSCNQTIIIPEYKIQYTLQPGENVIEFTPEKSGTFGFSCWMGMIRSKIVVKA
ncbi:hypothetical protein AGMMS49975_02440 [Clostridia bacterium]|nr:hypothetical protein AGMMS49975_02440 [Clostridia bacterium]